MANQAPNDPKDPWIPVVENVELNFSNESVRAALYFSTYYLNGPDLNHDFYLLIIRYNHVVKQYQEDWGSVGFYGENMELNIACLSRNSRITEYGPDTSPYQETITYTLGKSIEYPHHFSDAIKTVSFGCHEVDIQAKPEYDANGDRITWNFGLPTVGWVSPGIPANPGVAANNYTCYPGMIVQVPAGSPLEIKVQPNMEWRFDSPRGIKKQEFVWDQPATIKYSKDRVSVSQ